MSRQLAMARGRDEIAEISMRHVSQVFESRVVVLFADERGRVGYPHAPPVEGSFRTADLAVAQWVSDRGKPAGRGTDTLAGSAGLYLPLIGGDQVLGVLAVLPSNPRRVTLPEQYRLLETFAAQIGLALQRAELATHAQAAEVRAETEAIRNALLASISHDLRTPLATIAGGAATLAGNLEALSDSDRHALASSVSEEALRMSERITTLLDLVRLETGAIQPRFDLYALDELIGSVLHRLESRLRRHRMRIDLPEALPLLRVDGRLIEQVLENLLDNASKYTPPGTEIRISALALRRQVEVNVEDDGPGLPATDPEILFEKFQRGAPEGRRRRHRSRARDLPHHPATAPGPHLGRAPLAARRGLPLHGADRERHAARGGARRQRLGCGRGAQRRCGARESLSHRARIDDHLEPQHPPHRG